MENIDIEETSLFIFNLAEEFFSNYVKNTYFINHTTSIDFNKDHFLNECYSSFMDFLLSDDSVNYQYKKQALIKSVEFYNDLHERLIFLKEETKNNYLTEISNKIKLSNVVLNIINDAEKNLNKIISLENKIINYNNNNNNIIFKNRI